MASPRALVLAALLYLAMAVGYSNAAWCVCKSGVSDAVLQKALDYACGNGGDCSPIRPNGVCYNPNTVQAHCSYAVNSYYQKKSQAGATCDFGGAAILTNSNPSSNSGCAFPASGGASGSTGTTPATSVPTTSPTTPTTTPVSVTPGSGATPVSGTPGSGTGTPVSGTPTTSSPYTTAPSTTGGTTPSSGTGTGTGTASPYIGGVSSGIAPTGVGMNDENHAHRIRLESTTTFLCSVLLGALVLLLWN